MNVKKIIKSVDAILLKMNRMELHVSDYEWLNRQLRFISRQLESEKSSDICSISDRVFTIAIIRDLNAMVISGHITSSKMVELMNEAIKWKDVQLGNKYLRDMISDLKSDPKAPIT